VEVDFLHMPGVFVSYRRVPSTAWAGRIADRLRAHFGSQTVFIDVSDIRPGADFPEAVDARIRQSAVLIAVVDSRWGSADAQGRTRWGADDWVLTEVSAALSRQVPVIPVLVDRAEMPRPDDLPAVIRDLAHRNAIELSPLNFDSDIERLIRALEHQGVHKSFLKRIGVVRGGLILAMLAALAALSVLQALDIVRERSLRDRASGPVAPIGGVLWERFEVSNGRYGACIDAGECDTPGLTPTEERFDQPARANLPVVAIPADQATAFCAWIGRRLPTVDEWKDAATAGGRHHWPWGDEAPAPNRVNAMLIISEGSKSTAAPLPLDTWNRIKEISRMRRVKANEIAAALPAVPRSEIDLLVYDWLYLTVDDRRDRMTALASNDKATTFPDAFIPDDVVAVDANPFGATHAVHHLVGNAAEWTKTTESGRAWAAESIRVLYVTGGAFSTAIDERTNLVSSASSAVSDPTIGFRCVEEGNPDE
jgi:hypothetical protein